MKEVFALGRLRLVLYKKNDNQIRKSAFWLNISFFQRFLLASQSHNSNTFKLLFLIDVNYSQNYPTIFFV